MAWTFQPDLLGLQISGDIGDVTYYVNKNQKVVAFPKDWRQEATSPARAAARERFRLAQAQWADLTNEQKETLENACRKLVMAMTGQNLYISVALKNDMEAYETVERQSGLTLPPPPDFVPWPDGE